ncbi:MAG: prepilin-type N-terminal cleavage/methylation domain-containing protein [Candidatus Kaiserbacteria bacterium]|nr:prepilin-type N-terminal cleavage/methylation domain-containing protein [Candidatus Kaiserbacteria bacterium]
MFSKTDRRGFTLIELLVVIAIIGILSSVVLASLNSARKKGRDARRIADIKQLQLALELYYDANGAYPAVISTTTLVSPGYIAALPGDPSNAQAYDYVPYGVTGSTATCSSYHLGADLETAGNSAFSSDADVTSIPTGYAICTAAGVTAGADFSGSDGAKCQAADVGVGCYDVKS